jgi:hypothetical protein
VSVSRTLIPVDPRGKDERMTNQRSINLAISARGLEALRSVDPSLGAADDDLINRVQLNIAS